MDVVFNKEKAAHFVRDRAGRGEKSNTLGSGFRRNDGQKQNYSRASARCPMSRLKNAPSKRIARAAA